ncbi:hypothetical protein A1355_06975 [Methylomonas koyamae]|uniref:Uncharacterized protein n=1 Tax=Methylomonas koyamae TaxID=702114 RepID=A0A177NIL1_9GAMM|nr:hypothetical protein A1355_06975 [Methylomonas koyamae]
MQQADAAAFLAQVQQDAGSLLRQQLQRSIQLFAAVAAPRTQHVAGKAFRMQADQHVVPPGRIANHQGQMLLIVLVVAVIVQLKLAVCGRNAGAGK